MPEISKLKDNDLVQLIENRWKDSRSLWDAVEKSFNENLKYWKNQPDWVAETPRARSKARNNRIFLATESVIYNLTARPSKPNVVPANDSEDGKIMSSDLQDFFLEKYHILGVKDKMRRGLRNLFLSRFICLKVFWDEEIDDFNVESVDSRNIRVSKNATSMMETEFAIEKIIKPLLEILETFPEKKEEIFKKTGYNEERAYIDNPDEEYFEAWIDGWVIYKFMETILYKEKHPYWDWDGLRMTANEMMKFKQTQGINRKILIKQTDKKQEKRNSQRKYEQYLYNHFDKPIPPYIFGTVLAIEKTPVGSSSLIEQVIPLQDEIDRRKRQISDNAEMMNGIWKVDTRTVKVSKAEIQAMKSNARGIIYGEGVRDGITIETGKELPGFVVNDYNQSVIDLDNIFGSQPTFRGEGERGQETATGRAILREQSFQRLDELIGLVDGLHQQLYNWWFQMMKVRYTESHYIKFVGAEKAQRIISLTRDDLTEGVEIKVIPGQVMPEDGIFQAERAKEEVVAGIIDPLTYFEETKRDNPQELTKRLLMYKLNPFSIVKLNDEDLRTIQEANALFQQPQAGAIDERAGQVADVRQQAETILSSPEFQKQSPEIQRQAAGQIREQLQAIIQAK